MSAPTGYSSLGLIGFTDHGTYTNLLNYMKNDLCHYGGKIWKSKVDDNVGHTPEEGAYWTLWIDAPANLSELQDVYIYNPANGDILSYNATLGQWTKSDALGKEVNVRARLGAHNINKSEQTFTINNTTSPKRFYVGGVSDLKQSEQLTISFDVSAVSGYSGANALRVDMVANSLVSPLDDCGVSVTHYEKSISVFNDVELTDTNVYFELRIPAGESSSATVTISNLLIKFANDASNEVTPYAEDNEVLTEKVASVGAEVNSVKTALVNNVNANGSKNVLPLNPPSQTIDGITIAEINDYWTISGTATGTPTAFSMLSRIYTNIPSTKIPIKETGIDMSKTYVISRQTKVNGVRYNFRLYNGSTLLLESQLTDSDGLYKEIDMSQYSTATHIAFGLEITVNTQVTDSPIKPMLCLKSDYDLDPTYVPPAKTNRQLTQDSVTWTDEAQIGAVNYFDHTGTSYAASNGVVFTVNSDRTITVTVPSSHAGDLMHQIYTGSKYYDMCGGVMRLQSGVSEVVSANGKYKFSGNPIPNYGRLNIEADKAYIYINENCPSGTHVFKPMLTPVSYNGPYVPYAKTNRELTDDVSNINGSLERKLGFANCPDASSVFDLNISGGHGGSNTSRILVIASYGDTVNYGFIMLGYWANQWNILWKSLTSGMSVSESNRSSTGIRLTFDANALIDVLQIHDVSSCNVTIPT